MTLAKTFRTNAVGEQLTQLCARLNADKIVICTAQGGKMHDGKSLSKVGEEPMEAGVNHAASLELARSCETLERFTFGPAGPVGAPWHGSRCRPQRIDGSRGRDRSLSRGLNHQYRIVARTARRVEDQRFWQIDSTDPEHRHQNLSGII